MKKFLMVLLMASVLLLAVASPALAQSRYGLFTTQSNESTAILTGQDGNVMDYETWVYGLSIYADESNSFFGVYDVDTLVELQSSTSFPRDEIGEPTQFEFSSKAYNQPIRFTDGIGMVIFTGVGFVNYGPAP